MRKIWKGKLKLRIAKEYPYYSTGYRHLYKVLFCKWGWSVSLWIIHKDSCLGELSDWAIKKLKDIFPDCEIYGNTIHYKGDTYWPSDCTFLFNSNRNWMVTTNPQVFFDKNTQKYYGFSHRAICGFGIGDMLFNQSGEIGVDVKEDLVSYYKNPKYRWKFIKALLRYHFKGDWCGFMDICEDETIGHGIRQIIPFRERGCKRIETLEEAFKAAENFADYVS